MLWPAMRISERSAAAITSPACASSAGCLARRTIAWRILSARFAAGAAEMPRTRNRVSPSSTTEAAMTPSSCTVAWRKGSSDWPPASASTVARGNRPINKSSNQRIPTSARLKRPQRRAHLSFITRRSVQGQCHQREHQPAVDKPTSAAPLQGKVFKAGRLPGWRRSGPGCLLMQGCAPCSRQCAYAEHSA